jgi:hypothetical protein
MVGLYESRDRQYDDYFDSIRKDLQEKNPVDVELVLNVIDCYISSG